ncbi:H ACA ribonucleoprotein complex subunit-like protein [Blastocystis sp. subtype 4]|uniref:H ACA ribonucleoprotein complex subunit-like protein n=1 Tax=Blastocystis sp. subtype 4 TaxID=944170 RepID=UPI000711949F|nr:H ACA ribonucleoprotein complex subunit-like protein [Blastocystis sp. subtype 4]KNB44055.1 H ACA ribonucleoprotein complex subunit-like protein [Blastocystis sp. subtype 4]|eukprot:XP_014527498.1 H ACA ribonucleoprotein complex subunit-like protein [Blastocystis sp. subtype 4]
MKNAKSDNESTSESKQESVPTFVSPIAKPLAGKSLEKKVFKLVKKAAKAKCTRRGVKEVVKSIRKNEKGVMILAANIAPMDVISHIPLLCEEKSIPYIFVSSKEALGDAATTKRPTSCIHVVLKEDFPEKSKYDEVFDEVMKLDRSL